MPKDVELRLFVGLVKTRLEVPQFPGFLLPPEPTKRSYDEPCKPTHCLAIVISYFDEDQKLDVVMILLLFWSKTIHLMSVMVFLAGYGSNDLAAFVLETPNKSQFYRSMFLINRVKRASP